jgi:hypothetical protein
MMISLVIKAAEFVGDELIADPSPVPEVIAETPPAPELRDDPPPTAEEPLPPTAPLLSVTVTSEPLMLVTEVRVGVEVIVMNPVDVETIEGRLNVGFDASDDKTDDLPTGEILLVVGGS